MTSTPSAPLRKLADNTHDPIASPDNLDVVREQMGGLRASSPARPSKSAARGSNGSTHATTTTTMEGVSNAANNAYRKAPDLGISSTVNNAYQNAPDLGVGATINNLLGHGNGGVENNYDEEEQEKVIRNGGGSQSSPSAKEQASNNVVYSRREQSLQKGPSSQDRVGKSQQEIGTETDVPTMAGAGTTVSPDETNRKALEKARSEGRINQAHVPEDYEDLPSHATTSHNTAEHTSPVINTNTDSNRKSKEVVSRNGSTTQKKSSGHSRKSSSQAGGTKSHDSANLNGLLASPGGSPIEMEKRRSFGEKFRDQIKGEMKILAGTVTGKDDKVIEGLAIKHGDHA